MNLAPTQFFTALKIAMLRGFLPKHGNQLWVFSFNCSKYIYEIGIAGPDVPYTFGPIEKFQGNGILVEHINQMSQSRIMNQIQCRGKHYCIWRSLLLKRLSVQ
ncbi:hypothetical protein GQ457_12G030930 [Hibiscus cannabinus]